MVENGCFFFTSTELSRCKITSVTEQSVGQLGTSSQIATVWGACPIDSVSPRKQLPF